jgi:hypothetical protein
MLPRVAVMEPARWRARLDGLEDVRRREWIANPALAGRRLERVAVTGLLSSEFLLRPSDRSDQRSSSSFSPNDA